MQNMIGVLPGFTVWGVAKPDQIPESERGLTDHLMKRAHGNINLTLNEYYCKINTEKNTHVVGKKLHTPLIIDKNIHTCKKFSKKKKRTSRQSHVDSTHVRFSLYTQIELDTFFRTYASTSPKIQVFSSEHKTQVGWSVDLKFMHIDGRLNYTRRFLS